LEKIFQFREQEDTWWIQILHDKNDDKFTGSEREVNLIRKNNEIIPVMLSLRPVQSENLQYLAIAGTAHDLRIQKLQQSEIQSAYDEVAQAQDALQRLNAGLEQLVNEKTADLQKAYQQLEEQNKQLQQLDQIKSDFVSLVSHELRAPLTNIRGGIELLLSGYIQDPNRVNSTLSQVQAEILRLSQFTESILDLSALDANRLPLYLEPLNLMTVINSLRQHYQHSQQAERFIWDVSPHTPPILADEKALHSILFHILDNALKYAPMGEITLSAVPEGDQLLISVSDQGPGIPQEALPFLFDRFYRVNMADAQTIYGHGLGLYMVRRFTEAMHGSVGVQNNPQGGAQFMIRLPIVI
jgi:signal transduction histidine kinase